MLTADLSIFFSDLQRNELLILSVIKAYYIVTESVQMVITLYTGKEYPFSKLLVISADQRLD